MKKPYTYTYYRYGGKYAEKFETLEDAVAFAIDGEDDGALSSHSIHCGETLIWERPRSPFTLMGGIYQFADDLNNTKENNETI